MNTPQTATDEQDAQERTESNTETPAKAYTEEEKQYGTTQERHTANKLQTTHNVTLTSFEKRKDTDTYTNQSISKHFQSAMCTSNQ